MTIKFANINDVWNVENFDNLDNFREKNLEKNLKKNKLPEKKIQENFEEEYVDSKNSEIDNRNIISNQLKEVLLSYLDKIKFELSDEITTRVKKEFSKDIKKNLRGSIDKEIKKVIQEYNQTNVEGFSTRNTIRTIKNFILNNKILFICIFSILLVVLLVNLLNYNNFTNLQNKYLVLKKNDELFELLKGLK